MFGKKIYIRVLIITLAISCCMISVSKIFAGTIIPLSDAVSTVIPGVNGDGIFCELFLGIGGGKAPVPDDIASLTPDANLFSPKIDFPHPGNVVQIGQNFQNFFSDTIYAPDTVRELNPSGFILRCSTLLKITKDLDRETSTPEIDIDIRIGSDDGFYLMMGSQFIGNCGDRAFSWSEFQLFFENEGLYQLYFLFAANRTGQSGLELQWRVGSADWTTIPQSSMYDSSEECDKKIFFEEYISGTTLTDQYTNQGIFFNVLSGNLQITNAFPQKFVPVSGDLVFASPENPSTEECKVELLFVDPSQSLPAITNYFSCFVLDSESIGTTLTAYNAKDEVLKTIKVNAGGASQKKVEFVLSGIRRIEISLGKDNDTSALDNLCWITPTILPIPDLQVTEIKIPETAYSGKEVSLTWSVKNFGTHTAQPPWHDNIYISLDDKWDEEDVRIQSIEHSTSLASGDTYTHSESGIIPDGFDGDYWVIIQTDSTDNISEYNLENNNIEVSDNTIVVITDINCPFIEEHNPENIINPPLNNIQIKFSERINGATFSAEDISLTDPDGKLIEVDSPVTLGNNLWKISFMEQSEEGNYQLKIRPQIEDFAGNRIDQDKNGICGEESSDVFEATFEITSESIPVNLKLWSEMDYAGNGQSGNWTVTDDGTSVTQSINGDPTFFISNFDLIDSRFRGSFRVIGGDDDFIGFVFGFQTLGTDSSYYLLTWKSGNQSSGEEGFKLLKILGVPSNDELWDGENSEHISVLANQTGDGNGWAVQKLYFFQLTYKPEGIMRIVIVDDETQETLWDTGLLNDPNSLGPGRIGFFNYSQANVNYLGFSEATLKLPIAIVGGPYIFDATMDNVTLDATESYDPDGEQTSFDSIISLQWDIGNDGIEDDKGRTNATLNISFEEIFSKGLSINVDVPISLTVVDSDGLEGRGVGLFTYESTPPTADAGDSYSIVYPNQLLKLSGQMDDVDLNIGVGESLFAEWDYAPATKASEVGDGFALGVQPEVSYDILHSIIKKHGSIIYLNVKDASGKIANSSTIVSLALPDLIISHVLMNFSNEPGSGQNVTFTAKVQNTGEVSIKDSFSVNFFIDDQNIGSQIVNQTIESGNAIDVSTFWIAEAGIHSISVVTDSKRNILELNENNNTLSKYLAEIPDKTPPENITNLNVQSFDNKLVLTWDQSANSEKDLEGYKIYADTSNGIPVTFTQNRYELTGLLPATAYSLTVTAFDNKGNENSGTSIVGVTLMENPQNISVIPHNGYVDISWDNVTPSALIKHFAVYVSETDFENIESMTSRIEVTDTSAKIAGLTNNLKYYFAVTTVNISSGERKEISTVSATPVPDNEGPELSNVKINNALLVENINITGSSKITLNANDPVGVGRVEFYFDDILYFSDSNGSSEYKCLWDILAVEDGSHILTLKAYDTLGNATIKNYTLMVALQTPSAPTIIDPASDLLVNIPDITIKGIAESNASEISLYLNGSIDSWIAINSDKKFSMPLVLTEGENKIQVAAGNRSGISSLSERIIITLDTSIPKSPTHLSAQAKEGGVIRLDWNVPLNTSISGYNIYRSDNSFTLPEEADKLNSTLIAGTSYNDLLAEDGIYYYRITLVSRADNESYLSSEFFATIDRTPPKALSIQYSPTGQYDSVTGKMAPGIVNLTLTVSEPLELDPFLSINPLATVPLFVELNKKSYTEYTGFFVISDTTPDGTAYAVFSARDMVGNRGTEIDLGKSIEIDTDGPSITRISIQPEDPIKNDSQNPVNLTVKIGFNEKLKQNDKPELFYLLSADGRSKTEIRLLDEIPPEEDDVQAFQATFQLPFDAGLNEVETLKFIVTAIDDLENTSTRILCENNFQVYQGDLPPLEIPINLKAESLPEGKIKLTWMTVDDVFDYQIFRKAPGEAELTHYKRPGNVVEFIDEPSTDGKYYYGIASIRSKNNQESISGISSIVEVNSDSIPPGKPQNFVLELTGVGIKAKWDAPPYAEKISYSLYRSNTTQILTVNDLSPLATDIPQTLVIDPTPSITDHCYLVTAIDSAGNESEPSNSFYLNFGLLPVPVLEVFQKDSELPVISWSTSTGATGYDIYLGTEAEGTKLNKYLLTGTNLTDSGYKNDERTYTVIAVDINAANSIGRTITLPQLNATLLNGSELVDFEQDLSQILPFISDFESRLSGLSLVKRGIMNRLEYLLKNKSESKVINTRLIVNLGGVDHVSQKFSLEPGEFKIVPVIVGGYSDLEDVELLLTTIEITPNAGEIVKIARSNQISIGDGMMVMGILNDEFKRGTKGNVKFTLENTSEEEIEIVTATNSGQTESNEIFLYLEDSDGNVLSTGSFKQYLGNNVITLANGMTVARIAPGEMFQSEPMNISIPENIPEEATLRLSISNVHYHTGEEEHVSMQGLNSTKQVSLIDTSYYGEIIDITPKNSFGDEDIIITGKAIKRVDGAPLPNVPLNLIISVRGFERTYKMFTSNAGTFSYTFTPLQKEAGTYNVYVVHPDLMDRNAQGQFVIKRVSFSPEMINLSLPKNYKQSVNIKVKTGDGTDVNNVKIVYEAQNQPDATLPDGIHIVQTSSIGNIASGQTGMLQFNIWADNNAEASGKVVLTIKSDESGDDDWGKITLNTSFSEAKPSLYFTPNHVETGLTLKETVTETIVLENKGTAPLNDTKLSIVLENGNEAPEWVILNASSDQGNIDVGERRDVSVAFNPGDDISEGMYTFYLRITSSNHEEKNIILFVSVTQSGLGSVLFKVSDIYTGTIDKDSNEMIQGLEGAKITLQNEKVLTVEQTQLTDNIGEVLFKDLPSGRYRCRVTANNHQEYVGRITIKPGISSIHDVFLKNSLVTVEWEVTETTIEDKYEIILTATYETDVPAAVVVAEPKSINLPDMKKGDVFTGEVRYTNYGLIRAENLQFKFPESDQYYEYEILSSLPDAIEAKESVTVPYRVTCLTDMSGENDGSGGGCTTYSNIHCLWYIFKCSNGMIYEGIECFIFTKVIGKCEISSSSSGGTANINVITNPGGGGSSQWTPVHEKIEGIVCTPKRYCEIFDTCCQALAKEALKSRVDLLRGEYEDDVVDLSFQIFGYNFSVKRYYYNNAWHFSEDTLNLEIYYDSDNKPDFINKDGVSYKSVDIQKSVFSHKNKYIHTTPEGFRWEDGAGKWSTFNSSGQLISDGDKNGVKISYTYEDNKLKGVFDSSGNQVIWYEYNENGELFYIQDLWERKVKYDYTDGKLSKVTDILGNEILYGYDDQGRLEWKINAEKQKTLISYNDYGWVLSVTDEKGVGTFFEYGQGTGDRSYYVMLTSTSGKIKEVWYDQFGRKVRTDINNRTIERLIWENRKKIKIDPYGYKTYYEFDEWNNLTQKTYPDDSTEFFTYDPEFNNLIEKTDRLGVITKYEYDEHGNMKKMIEAYETSDERTTTYVYDEFGRKLKETNVGDENTLETNITYSYDKYGSIKTITDAESYTTYYTYAYGEKGYTVQKEDARGKFWYEIYDNVGRLISTKDPLGNMHSFDYDAANNTVTATDPMLYTKIYVYNSNNKIEKLMDSSGAATYYKYNTDGKRILKIDPEGNKITNEYDLDGRAVKAVDGNGNEVFFDYSNTQGTYCSSCTGAAGDQPVQVTFPTFKVEYLYDSMGRKIEEHIIPDNSNESVIEYKYDLVGNLILKNDENGVNTYYEYDNLNRKSKEIDNYGNYIQYIYDDRNNIIRIRDKNGNITKFEYDRNDNLVKEIRPMEETIEYEYDEVNNLIKKTDSKNQTIKYVYDDAGRIKERQYYNTSDQSEPEKVVTFSFNASNRITGYTDGIMSAHYCYDKAYRKISETLNYGSFVLSYSKEYYHNGLEKSFTGPNNITYQYNYDGNNNLKNVAIPDKGHIEYNSYKWNLPESVTYPGGTKKKLSYNSIMRLQSIRVNDPAQNILMNYDYTFDNKGNIRKIETEKGIMTYHYDDLDRIVETEHFDHPDQTFTYDATGNRKSDNMIDGDWNYNDNNELTNIDGHTFEYDKNGNTIYHALDKTRYRLFYDMDNRLIRVEDHNNSIVAEYAYDPFGRRLWKETKGTKTYFFNCTQGIIGEYNENGEEIKSYGYKPGSVWLTDPLFIQINGRYYFYINDHLGTPQFLIDANGCTVWGANYNAFGESKVSISIIENNLRFPGQYYDFETGLLYNFNRTYDPSLGRYIEVDPLGMGNKPERMQLSTANNCMAGFNDIDINLYVYAKNNSIRFMDPFGTVSMGVTSPCVPILGPIGIKISSNVEDGECCDCDTMKIKTITALKACVHGCLTVSPTSWIPGIDISFASGSCCPPSVQAKVEGGCGVGPCNCKAFLSAPPLKSGFECSCDSSVKPYLDSLQSILDNEGPSGLPQCNISACLTVTFY